MAISDRFLACGSITGVVNLYDIDSPLSPIKTFENLTTKLTDLDFNRTGELLVGCSKWKRDSVKIFHINSFTCYSNWPSVRDHLKYPMVVKFNSDSSLLAIGND